MTAPAQGAVACLRRAGPGLAPLAAVVAFNAWYLRSELGSAHYLHDGSFHLAYLRWAVERLSAGDSPLDGIFPDLGLGFPIFEHYQVSPYLLTAPLAWLLGVAGTYKAVLYLLLVAWPLCVYATVRLLDFDRATAVAAGVVAPFVMSTPGYGFEISSYAWRGHGMWTQAWGMWLLALGLGWGWRALAGRRSLAVGAGLVALTLTSHLLTGLLLLVVLAAWSLLAAAPRWRTAGRAVAVAAGGLAASAWLLVPAYLDRGGTAFANPDGTFWRDSYGVGKVLSWLVRGELLDAGRFPVLTLLAAAGLVALVARCRRDANARAVLALFAVSLALFCGSTVVGPVVDRLPAREVLFLHRMVVGVHLAGMVLAGAGAAATFRLAGGLVRRLAARAAVRAATSGRVAAVSAVVTHRIRSVRMTPRHRIGARSRGPRVLRGAVVGVAVGVGVVALSPAWKQHVRWLDEQDLWVEQQSSADAGEGRDFAALVAIAEAGGGRLYAGTRSGWGDDHKVGFVPGYIELLNLGAPAVGFTGRVPALTEQSEGWFNPDNRAQVELFDVRWQIRPADREGPPGARLVASRGRHNLWRTDTSGPVLLGDSTAAIPVGKEGPAEASAGYFGSDQALVGRFPLLDLGQGGDLTPTEPAGGPPAGPAGRVVMAGADPSGNRYTATVEAAREAVLVAKTSAHPRWTARVDGRPAPTKVVAPGLVAVDVPAGRHQVEVRFAGFPLAPRLALAALAVVALGALAGVDRARRRRAAARPGAPDAPETAATAGPGEGDGVEPAVPSPTPSLPGAT